ncbi:polysaccharide deacetylase family protein [Nocardioides sp. KIGAM211]|uniref:Polysaccharide deacetylase family protein n=1 Tax=Nocardioides luti TaxID=2761101 RepID=A0A7X0RMD7_9ACTN|nr:polysaccharide deacetylase family protein [Nocardioides luti]MBB6629749.1 polysaccharide deacetylase family protein [Nocardioides luti]
MSATRTVAVLGAAAGVLHLAPATTALGPVRRLGLDRLSGVGSKERVAITFDDGPDPASTPAFLDVLADLDVRATFFLLGRMLTRAPWMGLALVEAGHEIGVHGWDHRPLALRGPGATYPDLARTCREIERRCRVTPTFYRPPYGVLTWSGLAAARRLSLSPVLWTAWGADWRRSASPASIRATVGRRLQPGGTVLLHDSDCTSSPGSWRATLEALPGIVADIRGAGLTPGPLGAHGLGGAR